MFEIFASCARAEMIETDEEGGDCVAGNGIARFDAIKAVHSCLCGEKVVRSGLLT